MKWYAIVFTAIVIEGIIEYIKLAFEKRICWEMLGAIAVGELSAFAFGLDLFAIAGIPAQIPYVGLAMTGILIARGSNYIFDLVGKLTEASGKLASSLPLAEDETSIAEHEDVGVG